MLSVRNNFSFLQITLFTSQQLFSIRNTGCCSNYFMLEIMEILFNDFSFRISTQQTSMFPLTFTGTCCYFCCIPASIYMFVRCNIVIIVYIITYTTFVFVISLFNACWSYHRSYIHMTTFYMLHIRIYLNVLCNCHTFCIAYPFYECVAFLDRRLWENNDTTIWEFR